MLLGGDEFGRTQHGNNNAWCQDNETSWLAWPELAEEQQADIEFVARLIALRRAHPILRAPCYLHGQREDEEGIQDILWYGVDGNELDHEAWHAPDTASIGMLLNGRMGVATDLSGETVYDGCLFVIFHTGIEAIEFVLPRALPGTGWRRLFDTAGEPPWSEENYGGESLQVGGYSVVVLERLHA